ncbi:MAG: acyl carrier protein [Ruminococcus sp.]|nr:acyl carrier protein [Ruminococcus sp.]MBR6872364.1 acyl carrier protein [Ruminococcus sp.]
MVFETVAKIIAERIDCDPSEIKRESAFRDLGIDSLDIVDLTMNLEDELGIELELDQKVETIGDLVDFIEAKQE